ncbi:MAG: FAD-binding oxidoreductase, partial [Actinomycetia bacterium]|nr:FAD-binding oxidoreductase [Actinomycetes bacterium]
MTTRTDVVVIGAGIAGLSAAWALATEASVVVIEQELLPATHTSGRSAALISETSGPPEVCALAAASRPFLTDPPESFTPVPLLHPRGMLWVTDSPGGLNQIATQASEQDIEHQVLSAAAAVEQVSVLRQDWVAEAVLEPQAKTIDVAALIEAYRRGLLDRGGHLSISSPAIGARRVGDHWEVEVPDETIVCDLVIDAAGAWADQVAGIAGLEPLGLRPLRRTAFTFPVPHPDRGHWPLVMNHGGRFYFQPEGEGLLASPADETPCEPHDARADELAMAKATDALAEATTLRVQGVNSRWAGLRTFAPDRLPVVGFDPRDEGWFWLAGQGG